jgi:DUF4097 and DUF4098 domain-containing protein YvlB
MYRNPRLAKVATLVLFTTATLLASGETKKEIRFKAGSRSNISIVNQYGPISVKASPGNDVLITAILHSDKVEVDQNQNGNRIDIVSHLLPGANSDNGRIDYEISVPADAGISLRSTTGPLRVEGMRGDVVVEGASANVDIREVSHAHVHVNTLSGPITLTNVSEGHVEITSISGDVVMNQVDGPLVKVSSSSGKIRYDGDFAYGGDYYLTSHTGDIEATAPTYASIDVTARSVKGEVENDFPLTPKTHVPFLNSDAIRNLVGTAGKAASSVKLNSFSGRIHLKKRK